MPGKSTKSSESKSSASKSSKSSKMTAPHLGSSSSQTTTDHETVRKWAEDRGGQPACVKGTGGKGDIGMLRIDFPGYSGEESLQHIDWDEWFEKFDERQLALLYQEQTAGGAKSNFNKLVSRETAEQSKKPKKTARARGA